MPQIVKTCYCGTNDWVSLMTTRIDSLGYEELLWCKDCGTIKRICKPNGSPNTRTLDYRHPKNSSVSLQVVK